MAEIVTMPRLSDTMEEGTVAKWHKSIGDKVEEGDVLAEIETDKATMEYEAFQEGTLLHIGIKEGDTTAVDNMLAILGEEGEDISSLLKDGDSNGGAKKEQEGSSAESEPAENEKKSSSDSESSDKEESEKLEKEDTKEKETPSTTTATNDNGGRIKASPLAKKLAEDKGIDISAVKGTGEGGRIVKRDVDDFRADATSAANVQPQTKASATEPPANLSYEEVNVSQMRKTIAKRLAESKFTAPHFYLTQDIDMDAAIEARKRINEMAEVKISFNDFVVKASAVALKQHPVINSSWAGDKIRRNNDINIGVAVAVDEGLLVPVIRHTDRQGLSAINKQVKDLAGKARDKKLKPEEWEGNTFTISNLGMFGIEQFTAIINAPDSCILAVGGIKQIPVVKNNQVVPGNVMKVTLSCDHRVVDGASGAAFLQTVKQILEDPMRMLL
jgi:pyruvate dehydrogenase E2 component (dihydrolipoamide acetyltransferase)